LVEAVHHTLEYRRYYHGVYNGRTYILEEAAKKVQAFEKKTLDDYTI